MNRLALLVLAAASAPLLSAPAAAQFTKPDDAVAYRQGAMSIQDAHFRRMAAMANGRVPYDQATAVANAEVVDFIVKLPWAAFGPGMVGGDAKPEIWKEQPKFKELSDKLETQAGQLLVAAKSGDVGQLKTALGDMDETCKSCHDSFRKK
jgi:cytochrome c556